MTTATDRSPAAARPSPTPPGTGRRRLGRRGRAALLRWAVLTPVLAFFLIPLIAMLDFSTRTLGGKRTGKAWAALVDPEQLSSRYRPLWDGLLSSAVLVVLTVVLMAVLLVPTMIWVRMRVPGLRRTMEFLCLLPLTIPAIVLVVGLAPIYRGVSEVLSTSAIWLCFAYVILVLPFAYRSLDAGLAAIDVTTLSEAARSLGAGWWTLVWRVILPNLRGALLAASFLSVALVLGEFTVASLLSRNNLQTGIYTVSQAEPRLATAIALLALVLVFVLLLGLSLISGRRRPGRTASRKES
ncbi:ABC transporter permease subunit [Nakamurella flavida]|uniref:ABC transporter permease subunit n=1 Tax=Nakamurella flavida TaxID=363630 RepID=A0A938YHB4_9ACTN|nr:ABC transporter permease subunit [Nakamurella flavida]MBM9477681.1 ABC transporter permease subunit [Nakamurella flavida]MDP9779233.1 putative spermidine/putrescine transport system permease protein [Nakamurella flavida]